MVEIIIIFAKMTPKNILILVIVVLALLVGFYIWKDNLPSLLEQGAEPDIEVVGDLENTTNNPIYDKKNPVLQPPALPN